VIKSLSPLTAGIVVKSTNGNCYTIGSLNSGPESAGTVSYEVSDCNDGGCAPAATSTPNPTATPQPPTPTPRITCTLYQNNNTYDLTGINYTTCGGTVITNATILGTDSYGGPTGQSICAQDGTLSGGSAGSLNNVGSCT
jgi:hypothetical protein